MHNKNIIMAILLVFLTTLSPAIADDKSNDYNLLKKEAFKTIESALFDQKIHSNMKVDIFGFLIKLASKSNEDEKSQNEEFSNDLIDNPDVSSTPIDILQDKEDNDKNSAINPKLPDEAVLILSKSLKDSNRNMNLYALEIISKGKIKSLLPEVVAKLESVDSSDYDLLLSIIATLGKIGDSSTVAVLEKFLSDSDMRIRLNALQSISEIPSDSAKQLLKKELKSSDLELALLSSGSLAEDGNEDAIKLLSEGIKSPVSLTREKTLISMTNITNPAILPVLSEGMKINDDICKAYILSIVGNINSEESVKIIKSAMNDENLLPRAFLALSDNTSSEVYKIFENTMSSKELSKKMIALFVMSKMKTPKIIPALKMGLNDENETVRVTSAKILHSLKDSSGIEVLKNALNSDDSKISLSAASFLGYIGDNKGTEVLKKALDDIDLPSWKRLDISILLEKTGDTSILPKLEYLLEQQRPSSLPNELSPKLETLKKLMKNDSKWVQLNTSLFLSRLKDNDCVPVLEKLATDNDIAIRVGAIKILGELGNINVLPILEKHLNDEAVRVRVNSAESIIEILDSQQNKAS